MAATALAGHAQEAGDSRSGVRIIQIRNAMLHVDYASTRFLVDPMLSDRRAWPGFEGTVNSEERNPLVHLPLSMDEIIATILLVTTARTSATNPPRAS